MERLVVAPDALERAEELIDLEKVRDHVTAALDALSGDVREAVVLRVVEGLSYPEAARLAGCREDLMRQRVSRGLKRLARDLAVLRDDPEVHDDRRV
jgi:RNA polymerase sigma-70 factor (ECF subfamily)